MSLSFVICCAILSTVNQVKIHLKALSLYWFVVDLDCPFKTKAIEFQYTRDMVTTFKFLATSIKFPPAKSI